MIDVASPCPQGLWDLEGRVDSFILSGVSSCKRGWSQDGSGCPGNICVGAGDSSFSTVSLPGPHTCTGALNGTLAVDMLHTYTHLLQGDKPRPEPRAKPGLGQRPALSCPALLRLDSLPRCGMWSWL